MTTARWHEFEREIADLLKNAGFQVTLNAKAARPRQTDLYAHDDKLHLLVEAKCRKRPIDVGDIGALRSRLDRTRSDNIGVIFSTSGLSRGAKDLIEAERTREILTFVGPEIEQLRRGGQNIRALIEQKRESLAVHGKVWQSAGPRSRYRNVPIPSSEIEFRIGDQCGHYFESISCLSGASYALHIHDTGWGNLGGEGARLAIQLTLNGIDELRDLLGYLHKMFGLSKNGMFFIHQTECAWHGVGAHNFIDAVSEWRERYRRSPAEKFHHSEEIGYFDRFHTGWIEVSAQQRVFWDDALRDSFLHYAEIVIQLPGIPVDTSRFLALCQYANNEWAHFEYISQRWTASRRLEDPVRLKVIGTVTSVGPDAGDGSQARTIVGLIASNPYYKKERLPEELNDPEIPSLHSLLECELLLCDLRDWHDDRREADYYELEGFEVTEGGRGSIIRPFGTWNKLSAGRAKRPAKKRPTKT